MIVFDTDVISAALREALGNTRVAAQYVVYYCFTEPTFAARPKFTGGHGYYAYPNNVKD